MTRKEVILGVTDAINDVAMEGAKVTRNTVERVVNALFDKVLPDALVDGDTISINDFGKFKPVTRGARTGRNPQTGEAIEIEEKASVKFSLAGALKEKLN